MPIARRLLIPVALMSLAGCAAVDSLDRLADQVETRSNCHTSSGEWVGGPSCSLEWSATKTTSTTTTTVVTTTTPASQAVEAQQDES